MKHDRKLTLREKKLMEERGFNPDEFYRLKRIGRTTEFRNSKTGVIIALTRE